MVHTKCQSSSVREGFIKKKKWNFSSRRVVKARFDLFVPNFFRTSRAKNTEISGSGEGLDLYRFLESTTGNHVGSTSYMVHFLTRRSFFIFHLRAAGGGQLKNDQLHFFPFIISLKSILKTKR